MFKKGFVTTADKGTRERTVPSTPSSIVLVPHPSSLCALSIRLSPLHPPLAPASLPLLLALPQVFHDPTQTQHTGPISLLLLNAKELLLLLPDLRHFLPPKKPLRKATVLRRLNNRATILLLAVAQLTAQFLPFHRFLTRSGESV